MMFRTFCETLNQRLNIKHDNLFNILGYEQPKGSLDILCGAHHSIKIYYEIYKLDLAEEIKKRNQTKVIFYQSRFNFIKLN